MHSLQEIQRFGETDLWRIQWYWTLLATLNKWANYRRTTSAWGPLVLGGRASRDHKAFRDVLLVRDGYCVGSSSSWSRGRQQDAALAALRCFLVWTWGSHFHCHGHCHSHRSCCRNIAVDWATLHDIMIIQASYEGVLESVPKDGKWERAFVPGYQSLWATFIILW